ncbi:MAG: LD-carboxypeptidase [Lachnospiraceae bacterium]|uniref:LD-carboxypeptidase n=1 Tax=Candidatus Weimeria bifida TaxID=2599074 RepID=A0A6N7IWC4_9FIRM|nr:LD-carboxypeptidase [Candidatus Weimeria bifida]RRF96124.1 MAG: LD-carboxypeptidase [Lachnospiraceae bacterium]
MVYPEFLQNGSTIGIAAPSAGVGDDIEGFEKSIGFLESEGFQIKESPSVRVNDQRSADAKTRGEELNSLFSDLKVDFVMCAAGGDFLDECLPYVNFDLMRVNPKWLMGASDPTGLLYPYTTKYDVATLYGMNAGAYGNFPVPDFVKTNLSVIKGENLTESGFPKYMSTMPFMADKIEYDSDSDMTCSVQKLSTSGRCIGGCIDVLKDLIGTKFDGTHDFLKRYRDDGFIWYFDNFSLSSEALYRTLLQFRYAGWFEGANAVIFGRSAFESSESGMTYHDALSIALSGIPVIERADIGHSVPRLTMINGAMMNLVCKNDRMSVSFSLI